MPRTAHLTSLALALSLAIPTYAQLTPQQDPANLAGERVSPQDPADTLPINHGTLALQQLLRKLRTRASLMLIVAHPDDEDSGMTTFYSRGQGARVAMLTLNRGEGGQNLMSADFNDALGLIRTQELLAEDRYTGVDQFFGTEVDFGFSKTKEESFQQWTHDRVLYDAVRAVRLYRPLVIASVFIGGLTDGHGQHQVSGEITQEVFNAAGDPTVFPEMAKEGLTPWQPLKVYARIPFARIDAQGMYDYATNQYAPVRFHNYVTGKDTTTVPNPNVTIHEGTPDPLLDGKSYVQFARAGLALQKSQIGQNFRPAPAAEFDVSYHRYGSRLSQPDGDDSGPEPSFFAGIDTTLPGIATLAPEAPTKLRAVLELIDMHIAEAQKAFDPAHPELTAPPLRLALQTLDTLLKSTKASTLAPQQKSNLLHELAIKRVQLNDALVLAYGLTMEAHLTSAPYKMPALLLAGSKSTKAKVDLHGLTDSVNLVDMGVIAADGGDVSLRQSLGLKPTAPIPADFRTEATFGVAFKGRAVATRPYFSRLNIEQPFYDISDAKLRNAPQTPYPLTAIASFDDHGVALTLTATVEPDHTSQPRQAAVVIPQLSVSVSPTTGIFTGDAPVVVHAQVSTALPNTTGTISLIAPTVGWRTSPPNPFTLATPSDILNTNLPAQPSAAVTHGLSSPHLLVTAVTLTGQTSTYSIGYRPVGYPGLTPTNYYTPADYKAVNVNVTTAPNLHIAYLPGTGDDVPAFLPNLGVTATILTLKDLTPETLAKFDEVILGVRAYAAHPELAGPGSKPLLDFAAAGGVVVIQYQNARYTAAESPYPITTPASSGDHAHDVIDERQPVQIIAPTARLLNWPNKITTADFNSWVTERGHAFAGTWDPHFQPLLETHDPGQEPQRGGLLIAPTGKGFYVYCGLALYRQLPEGVPGAYRLLANILSLPKSAR